MNLAESIFYILAFLTIGSAINILFTKNVLHAAFSLLGCLIGVAGIFVFAGADFLAITQIMIYIGGVLILLLFGIMLTNKVQGQNFIVAGSKNIFIGVLISSVLFVALVLGIIRINFSSVKWISHTQSSNRLIHGSTVKTIGMDLMTNYILPFEITAIVLMVALMGAALIAGKLDKSKK